MTNVGILGLLDCLLCLNGQRGYLAKEMGAWSWENLRNSGGRGEEMNDTLVPVKGIDLIRK